MNRRDVFALSPLAFASARAATPKPAAAPFFDVRSYGAKGDGKTADTPAINRAIETVAAAGGGTLVFPAGTYVCFTIHLRSKVELHLSHGCTVLAADSPKPGQTTGYQGGSYDAAESNAPWEAYQDYGHNHWRNSLFYGEDLSDVSITGPGLIHGKGLSFGAERAPRGDYPLYRAEQPGAGNKAIALKNCRNVLLRDFAILKGGHFALLATGVDNLTVDNLLIDTDRDGFDIDCCRNVRVSNCTVNSPWDDAICLKSSYALGHPRPTESVTISNSFVTGAYLLGSLIDGSWKKFPEDAAGIPRNGRIKFGTESNGGFRNITVSNCACEGSKGIALESVDGALLEDIAISNMTMRDTVDAPLFLRLGRRNRGPADTMRPGTLRRVLISNLVSYNSAAATASILAGIPSNRIQDMKLTGCYFGHRGLAAAAPDWKTLRVPESEEAYPELLSFGPTPAHAFFIRHLKNLEMSHVEIEPMAADPRPAYWLEDVERADFFAISAPAQPNFSLHKVNDLRILWSRAAKDATLASADERTV